MSHLIAPSLLAADFTQLHKEAEMLNQSLADWYHLDVMDGRFVPNISFGQMFIKFFRSLTDKILDVHLMIEEPERYVDSFREAGADLISVHVEATKHAHRVIQQIKESGAKAGIALNPHTPISSIENILEDVDMIVLMSVNPGFGGQKFIYNTIKKVAELKSMLIERNLNPHIEIDGGVGLQNAEKLLQAGANVLVAGSSVFKSEKPTETIERLKNVGLKNLHF